jgi:integrase/recombinase XerD
VDLAEARVRVIGRASRERRLPIDRATVASLKEYLADARPYLTRNTPNEKALVVNQRGMRLTRQGFWLIMKGIVRQAGLPPAITPHVLRHSFARNSIGEGVELEQLRQWLGHASIATTQIYAQVAGESTTTTEATKTTDTTGTPVISQA